MRVYGFPSTSFRRGILITDDKINVKSGRIAPLFLSHTITKRGSRGAFRREKEYDRGADEKGK